MSIPKEETTPHEFEDLEHKLYSPKTHLDEVRLHTYRDMAETKLPTSWGDEPATSPILTPATIPEHSSSFGLTLLIVSLCMLVVAVSFTAWRVLASRNIVSADNIDIALGIQPYIEGGENTPLTVSILNRNTVALDAATVTLSYEQGVGVQEEQAKINDKRVIGTLAPNALVKEDMNVTVYGAEADSRTLTIKLEYKVAGANATFNKIVTTGVILKTPPIAVHVEGPQTLVLGQVSTYTVTVKNNTSTSTSPSLLALSLPATFDVQSFDPKPATKGNMWDIPALASGASSVVSITGSFTGQPGEKSTIKASVGGSSGSPHEIGVVYAEEKQTVSVTPALLALAFHLETDRGPANNLRYGDFVSLTVSYENKSNQALSHAAILLHLDGDAPILSSVKPDQGYFNAQSRVVVFDESSINQLALVPVKGKGSFTVRFSVASRGGSAAPALIATAQAAATIASKDDTATKITKTWTVQGSASLGAYSLFSGASFENTGSLPPQAGVATTYAIRSTVSAQNNLSAAQISFLLPGYVSWTGVYSKDQTVRYDAKSRRVTWALGSVSAGGSATADIQVSIKPSESQIGQAPAITSGVTLEADDIDTGTHLRITTAAPTTQIAGSTDVESVAYVVGAVR